MEEDAITVLVVGASGWWSDELVGRFETAGHRALRCHGRGDRLPCRRLQGLAGCPLDEGTEVAVVLRDRPHPGLRPDEVGAVCAIREGLPVVLTGRTALHPFEAADAIVLGDDDVVAACVTAATRAEADV